jgi:uncharacterized membrane protein
MSVYGSDSGGDNGGSMPAGAAYAYAPAPMTPRVRFEIIGEAWSLFQQQMGTWILSTFILFAITFSLSFLLSFTSSIFGLSTTGPDGEPNITPISVSFTMFTSLITNVVTYFLLGGLYRMALKQLRGQEINVGDLFSAGDVFVPLFLSMLLYGISVAGGAIFCLIPGLLIGGLMMLAPILVVDKRETSPVQAIKASWNALRPEMLNATLFMFVLGIVSAIGLIGCGIGIIFSYPLFPLAHAILYRDFFGIGAASPLEPGIAGAQNPWASGQPGVYPPPPPPSDR